MNKTVVIIKHEFMQTIKRKSFIIYTLSIPVLILLALLIYRGYQQWYHPSVIPEETKIGYVDETGIFENSFSKNSFTFIEYTSEIDVKKDLLSKEIETYLVIPKDYLSTGTIIRYSTDREIEAPEKLSTSIKNFLIINLLESKVDATILERTQNPLMMTSLRLDKNGELASEQSLLVTYLLPYIFGMLFMFAIFINSGFLMQSVSEEKENRVVEIMLSSVSSKQLLTGKIIGLGCAGLIQVAIWFIAIKLFTIFGSTNIPFLLDISIPVSMLFIGIVYFILGYLFFAALMAGLGSIGRTAREGQSWSTIFTVPAVIPIWFGALITTNPYGLLSRVLTLFPLTAPITGMMRVPANAIPVWELILSLGILLVSVVIAIWASAKIFRVGTLMHGKRPSIRDLVRYLRSG